MGSREGGSTLSQRGGGRQEIEPEQGEHQTGLDSIGSFNPGKPWEVGREGAHGARGKEGGRKLSQSRESTKLDWIALGPLILGSHGR